MNTMSFSPNRALTMTPDYRWNALTLDRQLNGWAQEYGDLIALVDRQETLSYAELSRQVERLAGGLLQQGIQRGDNVIVQLPNGIAFVKVCFALFRLGAVPVLLMPTQRAHDIHALCLLAKPVAYVIPDMINGFNYRELAREIAAQSPGLRSILVHGEAEEFLPLATLAGNPGDAPRPDYGDTAVLLTSGGTTGTPKLIPRTHAEYTYDYVCSARLCAVDKQSTYLAVLPAAHNFTLGSPGILGTLSQGGKVILSDTASCDETMPLIEANRVTHVSLVPALARLWEQAREWEQSDLSSLRCVQVGGGRLTPELARQVIQRIGPLQQVFGTAEGLLCFTRLDDPEDVIIHTQGRPLSAEDEILIVDERLHPVSPGEVGELITRGPYTITGYYRAAEHNTIAFTPEGFYRMGDLVRMTPEGNLVVEGRIKEQINRSGEKVSAQEIETILLRYPGVADAVTIAVADELLGERICACLTGNAQHLQPTAIQAFLSAQGLQRHKIPDQFLFIEHWPLTSVGKIDKQQLATMAQSQRTATQVQRYYEHNIPVKNSALDLALRLLQETQYSTYMLYEANGEWLLSFGSVAKVSVDAQGRVIDAQGVCHPCSLETLSQTLETALNDIPIERWRAYGRSQFEFSHLTYHLPRSSEEESLITLHIPHDEIRLSQGSALIRTLTAERLNKLCESIQTADQLDAVCFDEAPPAQLLTDSEIASQRYQQCVASAISEINAGLYQKVILSRRVEIHNDINILHSYWQGRQANTPARSFLLRDGEFESYGFSPETVLEADGKGWVNTQPLAGTRALTLNAEENKRLRNELLSDPKEVAEHAVSVKLVLEELEMLCQANTLSVIEFMSVYPRGSVQHLASRVKGKLLVDKNRWDAFIALFPAVTASGIPKYEALKSIQAHEKHPRGLYSGSVMILDSDGSMDAALVLRSLYRQNQQCWLQAGAGLVRHSTPEREWQETCEKLNCIINYVRSSLG